MKPFFYNHGRASVNLDLISHTHLDCEVTNNRIELCLLLGNKYLSNQVILLVDILRFYQEFYGDINPVKEVWLRAYQTNKGCIVSEEERRAFL